MLNVFIVKTSYNIKIYSIFVSKYYAEEYVKDVE